MSALGQKRTHTAQHNVCAGQRLRGSALRAAL